MQFSKSRQATLALILITAIWGLTFPLIKNSVTDIPAFSFVSIRFLIGSLFLWALGKRFVNLAPAEPPKGRQEWLAGVVLGLALFFGNSLQTLGMKYTSASNAGFITGLCVVMVPLILIYSGSKIRWFTWFAIGMSTVGIGLLSLGESFEFNRGDLLVLGCAFAFAMHIVLVGKFSAHYDSIRLTRVQILAAAIFSGIYAIITERDQFQLEGLTRNSLMALFYCGVVATALAFLIQNIFQKFTSPIKTALIFTCEPVFGAIFSIWIGSEMLSSRQYLGGSLMVLAMVIGEVGPGIQDSIRSKWNK